MTTAPRFTPGAHVTLIRTVCGLNGPMLRHARATVDFDTGLKVYLRVEGEERTRQAPPHLVTGGWS